MALDGITKEQEAALIIIADRELARPALIAAAELAQIAYDAKLAEYQAARDAEQLKANGAMNAVDALFVSEVEAKRRAVEDAKAAITSADAVAVTP